MFDSIENESQLLVRIDVRRIDDDDDVIVILSYASAGGGNAG
jgi:hypothetical protein